jgi:CrcB protein
MREIVFIAVAGACGSISRYALSGWANRAMNEWLPHGGTLLVNVLGSLIIGFVMQAGLTSGVVPASVRVPIVVGFLGAFTTFSSFSHETVDLFAQGNTGDAVINIVTNLILCLTATLVGFLLAKTVLGTV